MVVAASAAISHLTVNVLAAELVKWVEQCDALLAQLIEDGHKSEIFLFGFCTDGWVHAWHKNCKWKENLEIFLAALGPPVSP